MIIGENNHEKANDFEKETKLKGTLFSPTLSCTYNEHGQEPSQ